MNKIFKILGFTIVIVSIFAFLTVNVKAQTGDATSGQDTTNIINTQGNCGCTPTPTQPPEVTPTPTPTETVTPTPTETPSNPGNPGGPGDGRSDGRSDGLSSCPSCTQAPPIQAVLGLSTTSSAGNIYLGAFQLLAALVLSVAGFKFFKRNA